MPAALLCGGWVPAACVLLISEVVGTNALPRQTCGAPTRPPAGGWWRGGRVAKATWSSGLTPLLPALQRKLLAQGQSMVPKSPAPQCESLAAGHCWVNKMGSTHSVALTWRQLQTSVQARSQAERCQNACNWQISSISPLERVHSALQESGCQTQVEAVTPEDTSHRALSTTTRRRTRAF